jgi:hypothetical protein
MWGECNEGVGGVMDVNFQTYRIPTENQQKDSKGGNEGDTPLLRYISSRPYIPSSNIQSRPAPKTGFLSTWGQSRLCLQSDSPVYEVYKLSLHHKKVAVVARGRRSSVHLQTLWWLSPKATTQTWHVSHGQIPASLIQYPPYNPSLHT